MSFDEAGRPRPDGAPPRSRRRRVRRVAEARCGVEVDARDLDVGVPGGRVDRHPLPRPRVADALEPQGNVRLWEVATGRLLATLAGHRERVRTVAFAPDGKRLATAGSDRTIRVWDVGSRHCEKKRILTGHTGTIQEVAFAPSGNALASAGNDGTVRLWDVSGGRQQAVLNGAFFLSVAFAPDGMTLAGADNLGQITLWDPASGARRRGTARAAGGP